MKNEKLKMGNVARLLDKSLQSCYWLGFILSDGSFSNNNRRFKLALGEKDQQTVKDFCEYLGKEYKSKSSGAFMCSVTVPQLYEKLGITGIKTYCTPNLSPYATLNDDQFLALCCGFIDGDGNVTKQYKRNSFQIRIKLYKTWLEFLTYVCNRLYTIFGQKFEGEVKLNAQGYSSLTIANMVVITGIKNFIEDKNIKVMQRKWGDVPTVYKDPQTIAEDRFQKFKFLSSFGITSEEICWILQISGHTAYRFTKKIEEGENETLHDC